MAYTAFRAQRSAASLKLIIDEGSMVPEWIFPRSTKRGLIEAKDLVWLLCMLLFFPRSTKRGLIEACGLSCLSVQQPSFPRSTKRGLIEATGK
tara:strand:+ start:1309 stop:1587 length:279 start_codon:yes stop_codon:yes gene_type:complete